MTILYSFGTFFSGFGTMYLEKSGSAGFQGERIKKLKKFRASKRLLRCKSNNWLKKFGQKKKIK
jgi:hypothetical protein